MPGAGPDSEERFRALPSGKILTDDIQRMQDEAILNWSTYDDEHPYPVLSQVWLRARAAARATLRESENDATARQLMHRWAELDTKYGEPRARRWDLSSLEAEEREEAIVDYLHDSGLLGLREAEKTAPRHYLADREREGE